MLEPPKWTKINATLTKGVPVTIDLITALLIYIAVLDSLHVFGLI